MRSTPEGRPKVTAHLYEVLYSELRGLAEVLFRRERSGHTLQPTALLHEAYVRLVDQKRIDWQGRSHFMAVAAQAMRRVLVDHARRHLSEKRGSGAAPLTLGAATGVADGQWQLVELDDALTKLSTESERAARVAELKLFAGLSGVEIAEALGVSRRTVNGDWAMARMWLAREFTE